MDTVYTLIDLLTSIYGPAVDLKNIHQPEPVVASAPAQEIPGLPSSMPDSKEHIIFIPDAKPFTTDIE